MGRTTRLFRLCIALTYLGTLGCADLPDLPEVVDATVESEPQLDGQVRLDGHAADGSIVDLGDVEDAEPARDVDDAPDVLNPERDAESDAAPTEIRGPVLYPGGRTHSPLTVAIVDRIAQIAERSDGVRPDVFMKVGASSTVSRNTLHCFAGDVVDLGAHAHLQGSLDYFLDGDAAGSTPFDRVTLAARSGHSARWVVGDDPSPLDEEIAAIQPSIAFVHYGTNDMGLGSTYMSAMHGFHEHMMDLIAQLIGQGIVPVLTGISPRGDRPSADLWVDAYNAVIRGMAQAHSIPYLDLEYATRDLDGYGLAGDGIHLNRFPGGACILSQQGLGYGYNVRNLIALEALDRVVRARDDDEASDNVAPRLAGVGTYDDPFIITQLPFADSQDTRRSETRRFDTYSACADTNERGPEYVYRYETERRVSIRAIVLDQGDVDIDLHLLDETATDTGCLARNHTHLELTLEPGVYHFVLDTFTDRTGEELAGPYLFTLLECDDGDADCAGSP